MCIFFKGFRKKKYLQLSPYAHVFLLVMKQELVSHELLNYISQLTVDGKAAHALDQRNDYQGTYSSQMD